MPASLLPNQPQLIVISDLLRLGASSDFLLQFQPRPLTVVIVAGGALGAMTWTWQQSVIDTGASTPIASENAPPFAFPLPDPGFGVMTFAAGTYIAGNTYNVSSTGVVTGGTTTGIGLISATRFDVRQDACVEIVSSAVTWMTPRVVAPVISIGPQILGWLNDLVMYRLRSRQGMTPPGAGPGDDNARVRAVDAEKQLRGIGVSEDRPPDLVDSSTGNVGAGFPVQPIGDSLRGW